ncbi:ABC transporter ATP-binding protein [Stappia indica]|uniref:Iron complex transport system ATP-binding protein n=1 Tax=Stappia indica TaxID=538381 RepID=A0A285SKD5_9HYPH|nr:ATP-binding cassette domain-containing protein [Stappia indica]SOC06613.1 iron complex transport system ATP-binding protein [Stappia indica]
MIEIEGLTKAYDGHVVVDGVSLTIPRGGLTGIIGPNGAGKSTLLGLIARLLAADRGTVTVDGLDVATTAGEVLSRRLSVLKQDNSIAARLTVRDLVAFGRYPHSRGRLGDVDHAMIGRALSYLGLEPIADRFLDELSGGQRQRAYVAMVLAQDTDYMLFDEPLASLDIRHAVSMMHLLRDASRRFGKAVVVVLHDINIAGNFSDRIIGMKQGRVLCHGSAGDVMTGANLTAIYDIPIAVHRLEGQFVTTYALPEGADGA